MALKSEFRINLVK